MKRHAFRDLVAGALPGNMADLMRKTNCARSTVRIWLNDLRSSKECHIGRYDAIVNGWTPHYVAGPGKDAKKPKAKTSAEYSRDFRARLRKSGEIEFWYAKRNAVERAERIAKKPRNWLAALGL